LVSGCSAFQCTKFQGQLDNAFVFITTCTPWWKKEGKIQWILTNPNSELSVVRTIKLTVLLGYFVKSVCSIRVALYTINGSLIQTNSLIWTDFLNLGTELFGLVRMHCIKKLSQLLKVHTYLGNALLEIWNDVCRHFHNYNRFLKVSQSYVYSLYVKIALLFFLLITHGCGAPASWAAWHTTVCLDSCSCSQLSAMLYWTHQAGSRKFR